MKSNKLFYDDWAIEIVRANIGEAEFEKRLCAVIRALLEIDEILQKRESAAIAANDAYEIKEAA